jgi:hypothetical protein
MAPPLPQQECLEAVRGLRAHDDGVFARPHEIAPRFIRVIWHVDRPPFAGPMQLRAHLAILPIRFTRSPVRCGIIDGLTTTQSSPRRVRCRWIPNPHGPASYTTCRRRFCARKARTTLSSGSRSLVITPS